MARHSAGAPAGSEGGSSGSSAGGSATRSRGTAAERPGRRHRRAPGRGAPRAVRAFDVRRLRGLGTRRSGRAAPAPVPDPVLAEQPAEPDDEQGGAESGAPGTSAVTAADASEPDTDSPSATATSSASGTTGSTGATDGVSGATRTSGATGGPRSRRRSAPRRSALRRLLPRRRPRPRTVLAGCASLAVLVAGALVTLYLVIDVPPANAQATAQSNLFRYADGTRIARSGKVNRESVPLERVPPTVRHAFVAAENKSFYEGSGVDPLGIARALFNTLTGKGEQGGSTITQQYVKNYYLTQQQTFTRKIKEMVISLKVDRRDAKDDILAGYLNTSYFGRNAYGIQAAARAYYGKDVGKLTPAEGAYLAALLQAPSQYDWAIASPSAKQLVKERWRYVLNNMTQMHWLAQGTGKRLHFPTPNPPKHSSALGGQAGYLMDAATHQLIASGMSEQQLAAGGWTVTLTVDPHRQRLLEHSVIGTHMKTPHHNYPHPMSTSSKKTQTGAVSLDPSNGHVLALYGGRDYATHYLSNATRADYQAGPAFEPLYQAGQLENNRAATSYTPADSAAESARKPLLRLKRTAIGLGMDPHTPGLQPRAMTLKLGLMGTSPLEMAGIYASLDHDGRRVTPTIVKSAHRGDEHITPPHTVGPQAVSPRTAAAVSTSLTTGTGTDTGTTAPAPATDGPVRSALKSGVSDDRKASWSIGWTPRLLTAVGVFGEDPKTAKQTALPPDEDDSARRIWSRYTLATTPAPTPLSPAGTHP